MKRSTVLVGVLSAIALAVSMTAPAAALPARDHDRGPLGGYTHLVVIYEENHSFDNLYGSWGRVRGDRVEGLRPVTQVAQDGTAYRCLLQNDVNLTSPPLPGTCTDPSAAVGTTAFQARPFTIDDYISAGDKTCPAEGVFAATGVVKDSPGALPGGCTRDLVHRFYQEQYQIDGGKQDRYVTGSDAVGLTMGVYDTKALPIYRYLHSPGAPNYVVADHFFQAAFGGSFLNHQFLIAARAPLDTTPGAARNSVLDTNGMPRSYAPLYTATSPGTVDGQLTRTCPSSPTTNDPVAACGNYAVNTIQPAAPPTAGGTTLPAIDDAVYPNIGDLMTAHGVSWSWYSGGWDDAVAGTPGKTFQFHHQPFAYFADYAPGTPGRAHLKDEKDFVAAVAAGTLPQVSFVKPYGVENEHPGYASEPTGSDHLVDLLKAVTSGPQAEDTLVVVTYDEFGGQFDHVAPPKVDAWGPGTRIPALLVSARMNRSGVDHTVYDTTSILATIEHSYGLPALSSRDAAVADLRNAVAKGGTRRSDHREDDD